MNRYAVLTLLTLAVVPELQGQDAPSVTLFTDGRTLVRRTLPVRVPAGSSVQQLPMSTFFPSTFAILEPGVTLGSLTHDAGNDESALLRRRVGELFSFWLADSRTLVHARLIGLDPERWEITGSEPGTPLRGVVFGRPGQLIWAREQVNTTGSTSVSINADRARENLRVMYEAPGGSWSASYRFYLGPNGRVEGTATIDAGVLDIGNAEVQLLAGNIGQKAAPPRPLAVARQEMMMADAAGANFASNAAIGEVRLYTLPGRLTFAPGTMMTAPLFAPTAARGERVLTVEGALGYYGGIGQMPDEEEVPVNVSHRFDRRQGTPFGDLPLPAGSVSVYDTDREGRVQLVGQGMIGHTAPGEQLEVSTGTAFDVTARRTQTSYSTTILQNPRRVVATIDYQVVLKNAKDSSVVVDVRENRGGEWSVVTSSVAPVRRSSSRVSFPVTVPANGEATLTYRLRVVW